MDLKKIKYFIAVADKLSFTKAADDLYISQSALSQRISELEAEVGGKLLERNHHAVKLTPAGKVFLESCKEILQHLDLAVIAARQAMDPKSSVNRLRIGFSDLELFFTRNRYEEAIRQLEADTPDLSIEIATMDKKTAEAALNKGTIDAAVFESMFNEEEMQTCNHATVGNHEFCLIVGGSLHSKTGPEQLKEALSTRELILLKGDNYWNNFFLQELIKPIAPNCDVQYLSYSNNHMYKYVESGKSTIILPREYINDYMLITNTSGLMVIPFGTPESVITTELLWPADTDNPWVQILFQTLRNVK